MNRIAYFPTERPEPTDLPSERRRRSSLSETRRREWRDPSLRFLRESGMKEMRGWAKIHQGTTLEEKMGTATAISTGAASDTHTPEDYHQWMTPYVQRLITRQIRRHPYLSEEDLMQDARMVLCLVWRKFSSLVPFDDVCKLGTADVKRMCISFHQRARAFGEGKASFTRLDAPVAIDSTTTFHEIIGDARTEYQPGASFEARDEFGAYCVGLTATEQSVLREVLSPSDKTVELMERILRVSNARRTLVSARNAAISQALGLKPGVVGAAWRRIQATVAQYQGRTSRPSGYTVTSTSTE